MKKRMKSYFIRLKRSLRIHKNIICIATGLLTFPVVIGLLYKIPINFIDIKIGDLLSFYAVALGLFSTYLTYIHNEDKKSYKRQEELKPKIKLSLEWDCENYVANITLNNSTNNDYIVNYIGCDMFENGTKRYFNAKEQMNFTVEECWEKPTGFIQVGIIDQDRNEWAVCFEQQPDFNVYYRTCIDLIG